VTWQDVDAIIELSREPDCDWTLAEFKVLVNLAQRRNGKTGQLDPSLKRLAEDCHMDKSNLVDVLGRLEDKKVLRRGGDSKGGAGRRRPIELLCLERVASDHPLPGSKRVISAPQMGGLSTTKRVVSGHPNHEVEPGREPGNLPTHREEVAHPRARATGSRKIPSTRRAKTRDPHQIGPDVEAIARGRRPRAPSAEERRNTERSANAAKAAALDRAAAEQRQLDERAGLRPLPPGPDEPSPRMAAALAAYEADRKRQSEVEP
jgi:hypothetical protein